MLTQNWTFLTCPCPFYLATASTLPPPDATTDRKCSITQSCTPGSYESEAPGPSSDRVCTTCPSGTADLGASTTSCSKCPPGQFVPGGQTSCDGILCEKGEVDDDSSAATPCVPCVIGEGFAPDSGIIGPCSPVTVCGAGQEEMTAPTPFSDRTCADCALGITFQLEGRCTAVTSCQAGETEAIAPTKSSDRSCKPCDVGFFKNIVGQSPCRPVQTCAPGNEEKTAPTLQSDRECQACQFGNTFSVDGRKCQQVRDCPKGTFRSVKATLTSDRQCQTVQNCSLGVTYEASPPTSLTDRDCQPCTVCSDGFAQQTACLLKADTVCEGCDTCTEKQFESSPCADGSPRVCEFCTPCNAGQFVSAACGPKTNTACLPITPCGPKEYLISVATTDANNVCGVLATCIVGFTYETQAPSATSDRVCGSVLPSCPVGTEQVAAPTLTTDRVCKACGLGESFDGGVCRTCVAGQFANSSFGSCSQHTCLPGTADLDSSATTPCVPCETGVTFQPEDGQTMCLATQTCAAGQEESIAATESRDRTCQPCVLGETFKADPGQNTSCENISPCGSGTYVVGHRVRC